MIFSLHLRGYMRVLFVLALSLFAVKGACAMEEKIEVLDLDVISYEDFVREGPQAMGVLERALYEKGIVGIRGIPGYKEKVSAFIQSARAFSALPEEVKESYGRVEGEMFLGYEKGKEKFKNEDGKWVVDDLKVSYYGLIPDIKDNKWPQEMDLRTPFIALGALMTEMGEAVMERAGLLGERTGIVLENPAEGLGRMLYYRKSNASQAENPFWCGAHFDHGIFTVLLPAFYFADGQAVPEPLEAGLFIKTTKEGVFKKVIADDPDVLLFQVGEFGQLATDDAIRATEHCVRKASGCIERYTMALFFNAPMDTVIRSFSELAQDARYGVKPGEPCAYRHWHEASFNRYIVK